MKSFRNLPWLVVVIGLVYGNTPATVKAQNPFTVNQTYCTTAASPCVLTYHNNNNRDGSNPNETYFSASTLKNDPPGGIALASTDGLIYAQPLYIHQMLWAGTKHNIVYVATENNSVYAFDADTGNQLGVISLNNGTDIQATEIAIPYTDLPLDAMSNPCNTVVPEVGITGTPVIDVSVTPPALYVVTTHADYPTNNSSSATYRQKLHVLRADNLTEPSRPVILNSAFAGSNFDPLVNMQRAGLTLLSPPSLQDTANVWVTWGSHCDSTTSPVYHGLAIEFDYLYTGSSWGFSSTYEKLDTGLIANTTCGGNNPPCNTGLWMGGAAPAADGSQNVYLATGNDVNFAQGSSGQYSNSVLKLTEGGLVDYYGPPDYLVLNQPQSGGQVVACGNPAPAYCPTTIRNQPQCTQTSRGYCQFTMKVDDWDLGSGGVVLLAPSGLNLSFPEMVAAGKQGMFYVLFSGGMGGVDANNNHPDIYACNVVTSPPSPGTSGGVAQCFQGFFLNPPGTGSGSRGSPAFVGGFTGTTNYNYLYAAGIGDTLNAYQLTTTTQNSHVIGVFTAPAAASTSTPTLFGYPGASPSATWDGNDFGKTAIVWALDTSRYAMETMPATNAGPAALYAYQANPSNGTLIHLWDSGINYSSTNAGAVKFVVPTIVDGYIFMAGGAQHYSPGSSTCPIPTATTQPTACGGLGIYKHQ